MLNDKAKIIIDSFLNKSDFFDEQERIWTNIENEEKEPIEIWH